MSLKSIIRDLRDGIGSFSRRSFDWRRDRCSASASAASIDFCKREYEEEEQSRWASLSPELLRDVVKRVEGSESAWPERKHAVACAAVCRSWWHLCKEIVGMPETSAKLTFPEQLLIHVPRHNRLPLTRGNPLLSAN